MLQYLRQAGPSVCTIRGLNIATPLYTYCANHRKRNPQNIGVPLGPAFQYHAPHETPGGARPVFFGARTVWKLSPDTPAIREALLKVVAQAVEAPWPEYPASPSLAEVAIWQLGEFKEPRAISSLERLVEIPQPENPPLFFGHLPRLAREARRALEKISGEREPDLPTG